MSNKLNNSYEVADGVDEEVDLVDDPFVGLNISTSMNDDDDFECGYQRNDHVEGEYVNPEFLYACIQIIFLYYCTISLFVAFFTLNMFTIPRFLILCVSPPSPVPSVPAVLWESEAIIVKNKMRIINTSYGTRLMSV